MSYVLSILGLAVVCIAWYGVQRLAGSEPPSCHRGGVRDCENCEAANVEARAESDGSSPLLHPRRRGDREA